MFGKYKKRIEDIKELQKVQKQNLTDDYMVGLYNGIELAISLLEHREPAFETISKPIEEVEPEVQQAGRTIFSGTRKLGGKTNVNTENRKES